MNQSGGSWTVAAACAVLLAYGLAARADYSADAGNPDVDKKATALLRKSEGALAKTKTLTAELESTRTLPDGSKLITKKTIKLMRPNFMSVERSGSLLTPAGEVKKNYSSNQLSDGKELWNYSRGERPYLSRAPVGPQGEYLHLVGEFPEPLSGFFEPAILCIGILIDSVPGLVKSLRYFGREKWEGHDYEVVEWTYELQYRLPEDRTVSQSRLYIGRDSLVRRVLTRNQKQGGPWGRWDESALRNIRVGAELRASDFRRPLLDGLQAKAEGAAKGLPVGSQAPDFTLPTPTSGEVSLSGLLRGKKALIIWQWFYG